MSDVQCPRCFDALEVRDVTPCHICGGWTNAHRHNETFQEWRIPNGTTIVLCYRCELDEFMCEGGWGHQLGLPTSSLPIQSIQRVRAVIDVAIVKDKYCPTCNLRLAFLKTLNQRARFG